MLNWLIRTLLKNRLLVAILAALLILVGGRSLTNLPIDAFPDTTPVQVQINTTAAALNPQETEAQITLPVELAISGLPGLQNVRSISKFGLSQVVATFDDSINIFKARQLIMERLQTVDGKKWSPQAVYRKIIPDKGGHAKKDDGLDEWTND